MFSRSGHSNHPHIVLAESDGRYLSVNLTHHSSSFYDGRLHPNKKLRDNPELSYMVTDEYYLRDKRKYQKPTIGISYYVSKNVKDEAWKVVHKAKKVVK